ncbi:DUF6426 family protein [Streptomyces nojiriensis]|uniref:DUF6426 family protein n=1 Tax=Streptomyces nojiriensis TaxID=66374 RepID=UPI0036DA2021
MSARQPAARLLHDGVRTAHPTPELTSRGETVQLKTALGALALGVTVLTAAPALAVPQTAFAADCYTSCDPWDDSNINDPIIITGPTPPESDHQGQPWYPGGGGSGSQTNAYMVSQGQKWEEQADDFKCTRNSGDTVLQINRTLTYTVSVKVSANLTADLTAALKAAVGTELNTTISKSYGLTTSLNPGQSIGLYVEYQTNVYAITTTSAAGTTTQPVNVTAPTGVVTARSC